MELDKQEIETALKKYKYCNRVGKVLGLLYGGSYLYLSEFSEQPGFAEDPLWMNLGITAVIGFGVYSAVDSLRGLSMQNLSELRRHIGNLFGYALTKSLGFHKIAKGFTKRLSETEKDPISRQAYLAQVDIQDGRYCI